jgi:hypothetical protein
MNLAMINDRAWTIIACSAVDGEGKLILFKQASKGLKDGLDWLT